jgi:hypothetical protein
LQNLAAAALEEFCMGIASGFVFLSAICATIMLDRAIAIRRPSWAVARKGIHLVPAPAMLRIAARRRIHWIGATEFAHLIQSDPELVIFRLIDDVFSEDEHSKPPGVVAVTLRQLGNTLPWIPCGSRIVIYRLGGISASLAGKVLAMLHGREALFFSGDAHQMCTLGDYANRPGSSEPDFAA